MDTVTGFMSAMWKYRTTIKIWLMALVISNFIAPLLFLDRLEAKVMIVMSLVAMVMGMIIFKIYGMKRLLGLMHLPWLIALYFLLTKLLETGIVDNYTGWVALATTFTMISLAIDIVDVIRFALGDHDEVV